MVQKPSGCARKLLQGAQSRKNMPQRELKITAKLNVFTPNGSICCQLSGS